MRICGFGNLLKGTSTLLWRCSGPILSYQNTFHVLTALGLELRTLHLSAQSQQTELPLSTIWLLWGSTLVYYCAFWNSLITYSQCHTLKFNYFCCRCLFLLWNLDTQDKPVLWGEADNAKLKLPLLWRLIPVSRAPVKPPEGIIAFKQGGRELRITPASVKYCLTLNHYSKAPHHSILSLAFIASRSFSRSDAFHFTHTHTHACTPTHTRTLCADATSWQPPLFAVGA